jgi:hypothetical protein
MVVFLITPVSLVTSVVLINHQVPQNDPPSVAEHSGRRNDI